jgi:zinc transporter ZupT
VWLFIIAITLHNMPEGLAVGVSFGSGNLKDAVLLMIAIGIQNIPEGLAVSLSSIGAGLGGRFYAAVVGIRAGLVEIPLAVLGAWAVTAMHSLLPYAMGFAAGAMIFVISDEIIPETHRKGMNVSLQLGRWSASVSCFSSTSPWAEACRETPRRKSAGPSCAATSAGSCVSQSRSATGCPGLCRSSTKWPAMPS